LVADPEFGIVKPLVTTTNTVEMTKIQRNRDGILIESLRCGATHPVTSEGVSFFPGAQKMRLQYSFMHFMCSLGHLILHYFSGGVVQIPLERAIEKKQNQRLDTVVTITAHEDISSYKVL
jgi:hypothetical protein